MKLRQGFVSNSSASSYIVVGIQAKEEDYSLKTLIDIMIDNNDLWDKPIRGTSYNELFKWELNPSMWRDAIYETFYEMGFIELKYMKFDPIIGLKKSVAENEQKEISIKELQSFYDEGSRRLQKMKKQSKEFNVKLYWGISR